jgi:hypothetical protein
VETNNTDGTSDKASTELFAGALYMNKSVFLLHEKASINVYNLHETERVK